MTPPVTITPEILRSLEAISRYLGRFEGTVSTAPPDVRLRRGHRIRTIHSSLAIEGNSLSIDQVTAVIDDRPVRGPVKDILEVKNAMALYGVIDDFNYRKESDLKRAHGLLMRGLAPDAGRYRSGSVGIIKGSVVSHVAPPPKQVPRLMGDLFSILKKDRDLSLILKSCLFHYELEFIHPFSDGNGRMGRFWQQVILRAYHPAFDLIAAESVIRSRQEQYYRALAKSDRSGDSTAFVEFSLEALESSLAELLAALRLEKPTVATRLAVAAQHFGNQWFARKDYLQLHKGMSTATASRDLFFGLNSHQLENTGTRALTRYRFK